MKIELKRRFSGAILFALETSSLRLAVEAAVKSGADLRGADLRGAYLRGADLRGADLRGAYLRGAYLRGADLRGADLRGADLRGADLRGADLRGADLGGADLRGADLRGADLRGAYLRGADLGGADLRGADLRGADLGGADLRGADLGDAKLRAPDGTDLVLVGERPCLAIGPLGSRADYLQAYLTNRGVYVRAGCFFDTLERFRAAVTETHGDTTVHAAEYAAAIALIERHAAHWPAEAAPTGVAA